MLNFIQGLFESEYYSVLHHTIIIIHVSTALMALVVAPIAMSATKGGRTHIVWGRVYFCAMFVTNILALWLLVWRFNTFLFGVVATSLYGAATGYRVIYRKHSPVRWFDWGMTGLAMTTGVGLILWGILTGIGVTAQRMPSGGNIPIVAVILPIVFGVALFSDARTDIGLYRTPSPDRRWWWYYHMERMLGSYIGLTTALMVQQVGPRLPANLSWVSWVAPTAIGIPLVAMWIGRYRRKFNASKQHILTEPTLTSS